MSRNVFDRSDDQSEEDKEVPLTLGVGGPVIGTVKLTKDGVVIIEICGRQPTEEIAGGLQLVRMSIAE